MSLLQRRTRAEINAAPHRNVDTRRDNSPRKCEHCKDIKSPLNGRRVNKRLVLCSDCLKPPPLETLQNLRALLS